jgi:hypothetical protein
MIGWRYRGSCFCKLLDGGWNWVCPVVSTIAFSNPQSLHPSRPAGALEKGFINPALPVSSQCCTGY